MDVSIIIPYYHEPFVHKTVDSISENKECNTEIILVEGSKGMRSAINEGLSKAKGKFIMKCDAHCIFAKGFDRVLMEDCREDWLMIPRRYSINWSDGLSGNWTRSDAKPHIDFHYLSRPELFVVNWTNRRTNSEVDDTMTFQGSCWFANKDYFIKNIGYLNEELYGSFHAEYIEIGLKYWLGGGAVKVNKKTWYGHLHKNRQSYEDGIFVRDYKISSQFKKIWAWISDHWQNNREPNMVHKFSWLIDKFSPVPTWE